MPIVIEKKYKNELGEFDAYPDHWNGSMIECYNRGAVCSGCPNRPKSDACRLKPVMLEAVKVLGRPDKEVPKKPASKEARDLYEFLQDTKGEDGYTACYYKDMAAKINVTIHTVKSLLDSLVDIGLIKYTAGRGNIPIVRFCEVSE